MKSEILAVTLLRISPRAQRLFVDLFGSQMSAMDFDPFRYLAQPGAIADLQAYFRCPREEVFSQLVERISADALERTASITFTRSHLVNMMEQRKVIRYLSETLQCDENRIFDELFDIPKILDYLYHVSPQVVRHWLAANLQDDDLWPSGRLIFQHLLHSHTPRILDRDWGRFLDDRGWLRSAAMARIRGALSNLGYMEASDSKSLATIIDESFYLDGSGGVTLDSLAVLHIQRQIVWIVRQMIDHALEQLDDAVKASNSAEALVNLHKHVEAYELKCPAAVWQSLLRFTVVDHIASVQALMLKFPGVLSHSTGARGVPEVGRKLIARHEDVLPETKQSFWNWRKKKPEPQVLVSCALRNRAEAVDVLLCKLEDPAQIDAFLQVFSRLQFLSLADDSAFDIGSYLLSQPDVQDASIVAERIKVLLSQLGSDIIRGLILTGADIPNSVAPVWDEYLGYELPISRLADRQDTRFPLDRRQILRNLQGATIASTQVIEELGG